MNHGTSQSDKIAKWAEENVKVPAENVIFSSAHQHSTPGLGEAKYADFAYPQIYQAIEDAVNDLAPAEMFINRVETRGLNFVRHYVTANGDIVTPNHNDHLRSEIVGHESEVDNEMQLVKFIREGQTTPDGKPAKNIVLINYQGHPLMGASATDTNVHSDLVGVMRDELAKDLNCEVIYISGSSGNMMFTSQIAAEKHGNDYKEHGKALAKVAAKAEGTYKDIAITSVKVATKVFTAECNHTDDHLVPIAKEAQAEYNATNDKKVVEKYGFNSIYHVNATISHANLPATRDITFFVMAFGLFVGLS